MASVVKLLPNAFVEFDTEVIADAFHDGSEYVADPVSLVRFPRFAAAATEEYAGHRYYFTDEATRAAFTIQNRLIGL